MDVNTGERLVRIDRHLSEYFLLQTLWTLFRSRFVTPHRKQHAAFDTRCVLDAWRHLPTTVIRAERYTRAHVSALLLRNEVARNYAYNRALFVRGEPAWFQLIPAMSVRVKSTLDALSVVRWVNVFTLPNLPFSNEMARIEYASAVADYLARAALPRAAVSVRAERRSQAEAVERAALQQARIGHEADMVRWRAQCAQEQTLRQEAARLAAMAKAARAAAKVAKTAKSVEAAKLVETAKAMVAAAPSLTTDSPHESKLPHWGTPEARQREIARVKAEIEARKRGE